MPATTTAPVAFHNESTSVRRGVRSSVLLGTERGMPYAASLDLEISGSEHRDGDGLTAYSPQS
jgi:hypothetical protein